MPRLILGASYHRPSAKEWQKEEQIDRQRRVERLESQQGEEEVRTYDPGEPERFVDYLLRIIYGQKQSAEKL